MLNRSAGSNKLNDGATAPLLGVASKPRLRRPRVHPAPTGSGQGLRGLGRLPRNVLVVAKLDRLARSLPDARAIANELTTRQVRLNLGGSVYDPTDPVGRLMFNVLAMVAEFESDLIRLRTREGMKVAKAKGRLRGKQPKLNHRQEAHLVALFKGGEYSTAELADLFGVARSTVYRACQRERARVDVSVGTAG